MADPDVDGRVTVGPRVRARLDRELGAWVAEGLVTAEVAEAIRDRYAVARRLSLVRLLLGLGSTSVGAGLVWLAAANLDALAAPVRVAGAAVLWAATTVLAERRGSPAVAEAVRVVAGALFGAVVVLTAQALTVSAGEPRILAVWGVGVLVHAYVVGSAGLLVGGAVVTTSAYVGSVAEQSADSLAPAVALLVAGTVATALGVLHEGRRRGGLSTPWRESGAALVAVGLFVAALPVTSDQAPAWPAGLVVGVVVAVGAAAAAVRGAATRATRVEVAVPVLALVLGAALSAWQDGSPEAAAGASGGLGRALVAVVVYLAVTGWYAALGVLRDRPRLTVLAAVALVLFTTVQSAAVFAPLASGAALLIGVGAVLLGSAFLVERGRRGLVARLGPGPT